MVGGSNGPAPRRRRSALRRGFCFIFFRCPSSDVCSRLRCTTSLSILLVSQCLLAINGAGAGLHQTLPKRVECSEVDGIDPLAVLPQALNVLRGFVDLLLDRSDTAETPRSHMHTRGTLRVSNTTVDAHTWGSVCIALTLLLRCRPLFALPFVRFTGCSPGLRLFQLPLPPPQICFSGLNISASLPFLGDECAPTVHIPLA